MEPSQEQADGVTPLQPLLTSGDLQRLFRVTARTIARWYAIGLLPPPIKVGSRNRWRADVIRRYIAPPN